MLENLKILIYSEFHLKFLKDKNKFLPFISKVSNFLCSGADIITITREEGNEEMLQLAAEAEVPVDERSEYSARSESSEFSKEWIELMTMFVCLCLTTHQPLWVISVRRY